MSTPDLHGIANSLVVRMTQPGGGRGLDKYDDTPSEHVAVSAKEWRRLTPAQRDELVTIIDDLRFGRGRTHR